MGRDITKIAIVPYYYWYDTVTKTAAPLDVYMDGNRAANKFGDFGAKSGFNLELRWHFTLGLPSSAFFVDKGADPSIEANRAKYESKPGAVLLTAEIYVYGDNGVTLEHASPGGAGFGAGLLAALATLYIAVMRDFNENWRQAADCWAQSVYDMFRGLT